MSPPDARRTMRAALAGFLLHATAGCGPPGEPRPAIATPAVAAVLVTPVRFDLAAGDSLRLVAEALDAAGRLLPGVRIAWSVRPDSIASVDPSGLVAGLRPGTVTVTARAGARGASAAGTVRDRRR